MGLRGIVTTSDPESAGLPDIAQPDWDPFWEACGALGMPINFHIAASDTGWNMLSRASWKSAGPEVKLALSSANLLFDNARVIDNLLYSGAPERFPSTHSRTPPRRRARCDGGRRSAVPITPGSPDRTAGCGRSSRAR